MCIPEINTCTGVVFMLIYLHVQHCTMHVATVYCVFIKVRCVTNLRNKSYVTKKDLGKLFVERILY